jgi:hypothetical protein
MTNTGHTSQANTATYAQVLTAVITAQGGIADAYVLSGRSRAVGLYLLVHQQMTVAFFEKMGPAERFRAIHPAFLHWQRAGIQALTSQLDARDGRSGEPARLYEQASRDFVEAFEGLTSG